VQRFVKHTPELTSRKPEAIGKAAANVTPLDLDFWFERYQKGLEEDQILELISNNACRSLNLDESGIDLNTMPRKVVTAKSLKHTYMVNGAKMHERVTITVCVGADGHVFTPQIIFKSAMSRARLSECTFASGSKS
jgi:hypothetical protein